MFKKALTGLALIFCLFAGAFAQYSGLYGTQYSAQIEDVLGKMTLLEKIGQLMMPNKGTIGNASTVGNVTAFRLGSVLSAGGEGPTYPNLDTSRNSPADWRAMVESIVGQYKNFETKVPILYGIDAVHGHNSITGTTIFPHNIGIGCANDTDLARREGRVMAEELRGTAIEWTFAPFTGVPQDLRWGRVYEGYSQNNVQNGGLAAAFIKGAQSPISDSNPKPLCMCTTKHFIGDGQWQWLSGVDPSAPQNGTAAQRPDPTSFIIDEGQFDYTDAQIAAIPGVAHKAAIDAGVNAVMISYGRSGPDDLSVVIDPALVTDLLRNQYGFKGIILTDYEGAFRVYPPTNDYKGNVLKALKAGANILMVADTTFETHDILMELYNEGSITPDELNEKLRPILEVKFHLGLFEEPVTDDFANYAFFSQANQDVATEAVSKSLVLLQNNNKALPISVESTKSIALFGWAGANIGVLCGGWTLTWQAGNWTQQDLPGYNILQGLQNYIESSASEPTLTFVNTTNTSSVAYDGHADVGIYVAAENPLATYAEGYGDQSRPDLNPLDVANLEIVKTKVDKLILIIISGRPVEIEPSVLTCVDAVVAAWLPGNLGGKGIAQNLFGATKFSGKLSYDWPKTFVGYNGQLALKSSDILYPFGYGLTA